MSRQRLRAGMIEGATIPCPHCEGRGVIRSVGSMALRVLRAVEEYCQRENLMAITLRIPPEIALYILNHKRAQLTSIEDRHGVYIYIESKPSLAASSYEIERGTNVPFEPRKTAAATAVTVESELEVNDDVPEDEADETGDVADTEEREDAPQTEEARTGEGEGRRRKRRRRRGRDRGDRPGGQGQPQPRPAHAAAEERPDLQTNADDDGDAEGEADGPDDEIEAAAPQAGAPGENGEGRRRRRRGRRGRRGRRPGENGSQAPQQHGSGYAAPSPIGHLPTPAEALDAPDWPATGGFDTRRGERPQNQPDAPRANVTPPKPEPAPEPEAKPERPSIASFFGFGSKPEEPASTPSEPQPERKGWWQKRSGG
jgi:ribonuclease E